MNNNLHAALQELNALQSSTLKPYPLSIVREKAIVQGLIGLAQEFGREIKVTSIDSNGELNFNLVDGQSYGVHLAAWLSTVHTRTGISSHMGYVPDTASWLRINHFEAERLLKSLADPLERPVYYIAYSCGPDTGPVSIGCPSFSFNPKWMEDKRPVFVHEAGATPRLAVDEMLAHVQSMSQEMCLALQKMAEAFDLEAAQGHDCRQDFDRDNHAVNMLLDAAPWTLDPDSGVVRFADTDPNTSGPSL